MSRPAVLLVPGGSASCATYFQPLHVLESEGVTVVRHDRVGTGTNPRRGPVSLAEQAADLHQALQAAETGPAVVVGHSYGGPVSLQLALDFPEAVRALVLLDPTPIDPQKPLLTLVKTVKAMNALCAVPGMKAAFSKLAVAKIRRECKDLAWTPERETGFAWAHDQEEVPRLAALLDGFPADAATLVARLEADGLPCPGVIVTADRPADHKIRVLHERLQALTDLDLVQWEKTTHILHGQRPDLALEIIRAELGVTVP